MKLITLILLLLGIPSVVYDYEFEPPGETRVILPNIIEVAYYAPMLPVPVRVLNNYTISGPGVGSLKPHPEVIYKLDGRGTTHHLIWTDGKMRDGEDIYLHINEDVIYYIGRKKLEDIDRSITLEKQAQAELPTIKRIELYEQP